MATPSRTGGGIWLLPLLLLLALPATVEAQFTYTTNNGGITITGYAGPGGPLTIPGAINGLAVTSIGDQAFSIDYSLTSVTIPNSVTNIAAGAFFLCRGLTAFMVDAANPVFSSVDGVLFNESQSALLLYPPGEAGDYAIPNSATDIGNGAFVYCLGLTSVTIPNSVTNIGTDAFYYCTSLSSVTIPDSVASIPQDAFFSTGLTNIMIPGNVRDIGWGAFAYCGTLTNTALASGITNLGTAAFSASGLASITIPGSVISIGDYAFYGCLGLTRATVANGVANIGTEAFENSGLVCATIPGSVTNLADDAFGSCTNLSSVYFRGNAPAVDPSTFSFDTNATVYYLPGTTGWGPTFGGLPAVLWNPQIQAGGAGFGVRTNHFGFSITGTSNIVVVVEAATNLANPVWAPLATNTLTGNPLYFGDAQWTNYPARFYRLRSP
jgi:hypothetical protein